MNRSFKRPPLFFLLLLAVLLAPVPALGQKLHPKLKEAKPGETKSVVNRIVILPAQVSLTKDGMKGSEPLEKEAAAAAPIIEQALAKALTVKNLSVQENPFNPEALQNNEKLKYALADLQRNYNELLVKITKNRKDIEKGRFSLGDQVLLLNQDDSIDAFVFINAFGQRKSGGKKALAALTLNPLMMVPIYVLHVGIADARTGEVLAYAFTATIFDIGKADDKSLVGVFKSILRKIPDGPAKQKLAVQK